MNNLDLKIQREIERPHFKEIFIPKNQSCENSKFPQRLWCEKLNKPALYGVCEKCPIYEVRSQYKIK